MRHIEENLQIAVVRWFSYQYPTLAPLLHHSPNGGKRNAREGARFKAMGVRAGFPDLSLYVPKGEYHGLFVELKTDKGQQTDSQKRFERLLTERGYKYTVCRNFEEFRANIESYLAL